MKFSIIVPIYNVEKYIKECVDSILNQTEKDFELLLVDDGSPDLCPQICDEYKKKDSRIKVIHKANGGLVSARKIGAKQANGDYCICVDSDDYIAADFLEQAFRIIQDSAPDIIVFDYFQQSGNSIVEKHSIFPEGLYSKQDIIDKMYPCLIEAYDGTYFPPNVWAKVFKRKLYCDEQSFVDSRIAIAEDAAVTKPCIYRAENLYISHKMVYYYRNNEASMTKNKKPFAKDGPILVGKHFNNRIDMQEYDFEAQVCRNVVHNTFNVVCSLFNDTRPKKEILADIRRYLNEPYIYSAIRKSRFKFLSKGFIAKIVLLFKVLFLCRVYNARKTHQKRN